MSLLKDFDDLKLGSKWTALNIASTIPFFFVIFYLFNQGRIKLVEGNPFGDIDFYYILAVCFCLSIVWFMINFVISSVLVSLFERMDEKDEPIKEKPKTEEVSKGLETKEEDSKPEEEEDNELHAEFIITYIYSILYLAVAILANHLWFELSFKYAILITFGFIVFRFAYVFLIDILIARAFNKSK